jgi:hypothetical protein
MTWRIAVTGGITIVTMGAVSAVAAAIGCSTMASFACSPSP